MGARRFICPDGRCIPIGECLESCPHKIRCMGKPTLISLARSCRDRGLGRFSVTELIRGTRETFLLKTMDYDINPQSLLFAAHGTAIHKMNEENSSGIISELRLNNEIATGQIDAYGDVLGTGENILLDYKVTSRFKARKALGIYSVEVPTGEVFKTGLRKGQPKYRKELRKDGVKDVFEWALQTNFYRMLLEEHGYKVEAMYIQMYVRDYSASITSDYDVRGPVHLVRINRISDWWIRRWFKAKLNRLEKALKYNEMPPPCNKRESWHGNKCQGYCNVAAFCDIGRGCHDDEMTA